MNVSQLRPSDAGSEASCSGKYKDCAETYRRSSAEIQELEVRLLEKEKKMSKLRSQIQITIKCSSQSPAANLIRDPAEHGDD
jgi:hypothetical protein